MSTTHTIPAEMFLLLTTDSGRQDSTSYRQQALAAAAITELSLRQKVVLTPDRSPRVHVTDPSSLGIPVLDQALGALHELEGKRISSVIGHRWLDLTEVIGMMFAAEGVVTRKDGWFTTTWPTHDDRVESALRARLAAAVRDRSRASLQDAILLELLRSLGIAHRILKHDIPELSRRDLDRVIKDFDIDHPAAAAIKKLISDMTAVLIATTAAVAATPTT